MARNLDPMRHHGRKIQAAVSRDPAFEAMFTDYRQIPNTWGNLASQLMEEGLVEPTPEAATALLGIDREQLSDTTLLFTEPYAVEEFENQFTERHARDYKNERTDAAKQFVNYLIGEASAPWVIEEADPHELEAIRLEQDDLLGKKDQSQEEYEARRVRLGVLSLRGGALRSGLAFPLAEFTGAVVNYPSEEGFTKAERVSTLQETVRSVSDELIFTERVQVDEIVIGRVAMNRYVFSLDHRLSQRAYRHANREWERIEHLFRAPRYNEHPFFAGTEK